MANKKQEAPIILKKSLPEILNNLEERTLISLEASRRALEASKKTNIGKTEKQVNEYDVFISHSSLDDALATNIKNLLELNNIRVFCTPESIPTGAWEPQIENALRDSSTIWLLLTKNAIKESVWTHNEFGYFYGYNHGKNIDMEGHRCRYLYTRGTELRGLYTWIQGTQIASFEDPVLVAKTIASNIGKDFKTPEHWNKETTSQNPTTLTSDVIFNYQSSGLINTPAFNIDTLPWILQFSTNWTGHFAVQIIGGRSKLVINQGVEANIIYKNYIHEDKGNNLYFHIQNAPASGIWSLSVVKII